MGEGRWSIASASARGTTHARLGIGCQDARDIAVAPNGIVIAAAADGAGSAAHSADGARWAVGVATHLLWDRLAAGASPATIETALADAFRGAHDFIAQAAAESGLPATAFATTLLVAVASADGLHVAQTGDGMIVARRADGDLVAATTPQNGEYANETYFLTSGDGEPRFMATLPPVCALALLTDGLLPLAVDLRDCRPHAPFFDPLFAFAAARGDSRGADAELTAFLQSDRVAARTDDDTTLVLAVRRRSLTPNPSPIAMGEGSTADRLPSSAAAGEGAGGEGNLHESAFQHPA